MATLPTINFSGTDNDIVNTIQSHNCVVNGLLNSCNIISLKIYDEYGTSINIDINTIHISGNNYQSQVDISNFHDGLIYAEIIFNCVEGAIKIKDSVTKDTVEPVISVQTISLENPITIKGVAELKFTEVHIKLIDYTGFYQSFTTLTDENGAYLVKSPKRIYEGVYNIQASITDTVGNTGVATCKGYLSREIDESSLMQHYEKINTAKYQAGRISPGVVLRKRNITHSSGFPVLSVISGFFEGGPLEPTIINSKEEFKNYFGLIKTIDSISCDDFLDFSQNLLVQRVIGQESYNAYAIGSRTYKFSHPNIRIDSKDDLSNIEIMSDEFIRVFARFPGRYGNRMQVAIFTQDQVKYNNYITETLRAQDIIKSIPYLCYCVAVIQDDKIVETFIVKINDLEKLNDLSDQIYVKTNISVHALHVYDGNIILADGGTGTYSDDSGLYDGDNGVYDGSVKVSNTYNDIYGFYDGGENIYDGSVGVLDGNVCIIDGNDFNPLFCVPTFFGFNILQLSGGFSDYPTQQEFNNKEILENKLNFNIDIFIGNNTILERDDVVNIVPVPHDTKKALDFVDNFGVIKDISNINNITNIMFINGYKRDSKFLVPLAGEYAGIRSNKMITDISSSTSKISVPFKNGDILKISFEDQELLYEYGINPVIKSSTNTNSVWYCNGEKMFKRVV